MGIKKFTKNLFTFWAMVAMFVMASICTICTVYATVLPTDNETDSTIYMRDVYIQRLESKFDATREQLAVEVDSYIKSVAPNSSLTSLNLIDLCSKYDVDIRLALAQAHVESHFGTKGTAARTNSVFNVGAFDGHSASKQIKNGYGYKHPDYSVEPYLKLLTTRYLVQGKTEEDLIKNFVDKNGHRYAAGKTYEIALKERWCYIDKHTNIATVYNEYKMYKIQLGR